MNKNSSSLAAKANSSAQRGTTAADRRWFKRGDWGRRLVGVWAISAAAATALNLGLVQLLERQGQTLFFDVRGTVTPPSNIVILAIDESSLSQGEFYHSDPQKYTALEPIQAWPWKRAAYAAVINKVMAAGAKAVAIDVLFSTPSSYGEADDRVLAQTIRQHKERVILAARYAETETPQGYSVQLTTPLPSFCDRSDCTGFINYLIEPDNRIHRFSEQFLQQLLINTPEESLPQVPSLDAATLQVAQMPHRPDIGESIFFYGPAQTFEHIPFWTVLDPSAWKTTLRSGDLFKNKIVLIGSTASIHQDFHAAPFSKSWLHPQPMSGVEIHANAIATLQEGRAIREAMPQAPLRGLFVFVGVVGAGWVFTRSKSPLRRLGWAIGLAAVWMGVGYGLFVQAGILIPTAVPVGVLVLSGLSQLVAGTVKEQLTKRQLRDTLKQYVTSPIVQEIISQHDDLQDLLRERELALAGKILASRYQIVRVLGSGGFSETYVAVDLLRPGKPQCVVKQLRVFSDNPNTLKQAQRLFAIEAETLERLGRHEQIPQLLASFDENDEFYLVQEYVEGHPLVMEILPRRAMSEAKVVKLLHDLLNVLSFVHSQGVIHRDLKPSNIIRRQADDKLILIDFGVAKRITNQLAESSNTKFTIAVGTPGYMPSEQSAGRPHFNSDIYALGMIAIEALTGESPHTFNQNPKTGEIRWRQQAEFVDSKLATILDRMVHHDFMQRYRSVQDVQLDLEALYPLMNFPDDTNTLLKKETTKGDVFNETLNPEEEEEEALQGVTMPLPEDWLNQ
ncbi:MAG TPA: serine/threonine-protein kinase [Trichocoleus sp.]|jgi:CHASE2 domain-containing sensor protein